MSAGYIVAPIALDDIDSAAGFIATRHPAAARYFVDELYEAFEWLGANPHRGHARPDLTRLPVFFWTVFRRRYAIVYRKGEPLQIVRVLAWRRNVVALLRE